MRGERNVRTAALAGALAFALALGVPGGAAAEEREPARVEIVGGELDALLGEIAAARKNVKTLRASFVQRRAIRLLATTIESKGELTFAAPDRLRWELAAPDDVVYLVGPEGLSYKTRTSRTTLPKGTAEVARGLEDLRALLGGDLGSLRSRYELTGARTASGVEISGAAKDRAAARIRGFTLVLDRGLVLPLRARLLEGKSDTVDIAFAGGVANAPVDPQTMRP